jgi:hypothetical protein
VSRKDLLLYGATLCSAAILAGCGMGPITTSGGGGTMSLQGQVHGGQQPVAGSTIQLYTVGTGGNGTAATPMLTETVTTDSGGNFSITNAYTCGENSSGSAITSSNQVYLVATGGNPGVGTNNPALAMVAPLGPCSNLSAATTILVNELTTVAAAWSLAPFATSATHIAASATNSLGITNAFLDAALLVNTTTGTPATLPSNLTIETGKLNALADALAGCVNSDGTTACAPLFSAATVGSSTPTDTFTAALNIVKHPGQNVAAVFGAIGTDVPFATTLTASPNDWTMSLTITGGGLSSPTALGLDSQGNVWVANFFGPLSAFNPQGTPYSATGFGGTGGTEITQVYDLVVDPSDNVWVVNQNGYQGPAGGNGSVTKFYGVNSGQIGVSPQPMGYTDGSLQEPTAIAADTNGDIYIANTSGGSATIYNNSGGLVYGDVGASSDILVIPAAIAIDSTHGFWLPGGKVVAHVSLPSTQFPDGQLLATANCCALSEGIATDAFGNVWVADELGGPPAPNNEGAFADIASNGSILLSNVVAGGIDHPQMVAVDAAQNAWFTNFDNDSITEIAGNGGPVAAGTGLSPSTGVYGTGGFGLDAGLAGPFSIIPDRSGNLWISNQAQDAVTMFFGLSTPTVTPLQPVPTAP